MRYFLPAMVRFLRAVTGQSGVWIGEIDADGRVRANRVPLERAKNTHFNMGFYGDKRWRYREDSDAVFWWNLADITADEKQAVEQFLAARGGRVRRHVANTQQISVGGEQMAGLQFSHGGGRAARYRQRVTPVAVDL